MATGGCLCGSVRFEIQGRFTPIQLCHASRCQKSTGSAFAPEVAAKASGFRWLQGEDLLTVYDAPLLREPPPFRRVFCRNCGSPMPVQRPGSPWVVLLAGVLDEDPETRPFRHIFLGQKAPWFEPGGDLQHYEGRPPASERLSDPKIE